MLDPEKEQQRNERAVKLFGVKETIVEENAIQPVTPSDLLRIAVDKNADVDKLTILMGLQERYEANVAKKEYLKAVAAFNENPPPVVQDKVNKQYNSSYASINSWLSSVNPALKKHGLSKRWDQNMTDEKITVTCFLTHELGHTESSSMEGPPDTSGAKNPLQQIKSTMTYLRISTLESILGLTSGLTSCDDDGNGSSGEIITEEEVGIIRDMIQLAGRDEEKFLKVVKIEKLEDLTRPVYDHWHKKLSQSYTKGQK